MTPQDAFRAAAGQLRQPIPDLATAIARAQQLIALAVSSPLASGSPFAALGSAGRAEPAATTVTLRAWQPTSPETPRPAPSRAAPVWRDPFGLMPPVPVPEPSDPLGLGEGLWRVSAAINDALLAPAPRVTPAAVQSGTTGRSPAPADPGSIGGLTGGMRRASAPIGEEVVGPAARPGDPFGGLAGALRRASTPARSGPIAEVGQAMRRASTAIGEGLAAATSRVIAPGDAQGRATVGNPFAEINEALGRALAAPTAGPIGDLLRGLPAAPTSGPIGDLPAARTTGPIADLLRNLPAAPTSGSVGDLLRGLPAAPPAGPAGDLTEGMRRVSALIGEGVAALVGPAHAADPSSGLEALLRGVNADPRTARSPAAGERATAAGAPVASASVAVAGSEAATPVPLDRTLLAALVNEALVEQARLGGVDLT